MLDVWQGFKYVSGWHIETSLIKQMCVIVKTKCFYSFTNNLKSKQNLNNYAHCFWDIHEQQFST